MSFEGVPFHLHSPENFSFVYCVLLWRKKSGSFGIRGLTGGVETVVAEKNAVPFVPVLLPSVARTKG